MDLERVLNGVELAAEKQIEHYDNDYEKDGLLYCGNCGTAKQVQIEIFGQVRKPYCLCKCASEKRDKEIAEQLQREKMEKTRKLRSAGFPDMEMQNWTFSRDDKTNEHITQIALNYVDNFQEMKRRGKGLLLYGSVGTGKTFISACIANALIDKGYPCLVTNFARLTNTLQGMYEGKQAYIDSLNDFDLLVIDDLASERDTEYMGEIIQTIIDSRYRAGLPVIITTNLTSEELKHPAEMRKQRIYSRLFEMALPVEVKGKDRRKQKLISDFAEFDELLGLREDK